MHLKKDSSVSGHVNTQPSLYPNLTVMLGVEKHYVVFVPRDYIEVQIFRMGFNYSKYEDPLGTNILTSQFFFCSVATAPAQA